MPPELKPQSSGAAAPEGKPVWWIDIVAHWDDVICDMASRYGIDLYDPAVQERPWPGIRTMIYGLINGSGQLAQSLRR